MIIKLLVLFSAVALSAAQTRCNKNEYRCKDGRCISQRFVCDGWQDCFDGGDENTCENTCPSNNEYRCPNSDICLHISTKCNGEFECPDGGDELQCDYPLCKADEFQCKNGWCLHRTWVCDGNNDCLGGEDEVGCEQCPDSMFQCAPGKCIVPSLVCNNMTDCDNGKDEKDCCPAMECDGKCLSDEQVCDKKLDCIDGRDESEKTCGPPPCPENMFQCEDDLSCIDVERVCDGVLDCKDKGDEKQPSCHQMLITRKRMSALYNGFDAYVSKVSAVANYLPVMREKTALYDTHLNTVLTELDDVRRMASGGGAQVVMRGSMAAGVDSYTEERIMQLESSVTGLKSDIEFVKNDFASEKKARAVDSNKLEEVMTAVYLQKTDISKLSRDMLSLQADLTSLKYTLESLSASFTVYQQSTYGIPDQLRESEATVQQLTQKMYYLENTLNSLQQTVSYGGYKNKKRSLEEVEKEDKTQK